MLEEAICARIPLITTSTNDPAHVPAVLKLLAGRGVKKFSSGQEIQKDSVFWRINTLPSNPKLGDRSMGQGLGQEALFHWFHDQGSSLVWVNAPEKQVGPMWFDSGIMPTPPDMVFELLTNGGLSSENIAEIEQTLGGLTLKEIEWVVRLAQSTLDSTSRRAIASVRQRYFPERRGLDPVDTKLHFYEKDEKLEAWIEDAGKFLKHPDPRLRPRGLLFYGVPGTGKSMAAKRIAGVLGLPLYRLEMGQVKNKYVGNSEKYMVEALREIDRESPCVLLIDEIEKAFASQSDHGTTSSILASLLWWLQEHQTPVLTVMTTNKIEAIPPEVYRPGRIDATMRMKGILRVNADAFVEAFAKTFDVKLDQSMVDTMLLKRYGKGPEYESVPHAQLSADALQYVKVLIEPVKKRQFKVRKGKK